MHFLQVYGIYHLRLPIQISFRKEVTRGEKLIFFCQLASQYADELRFTDTYEISDEVEYPFIYAK